MIRLITLNQINSFDTILSKIELHVTDILSFVDSYLIGIGIDKINKGRLILNYIHYWNYLDLKGKILYL